VHGNLHYLFPLLLFLILSGMSAFTLYRYILNTSQEIGWEEHPEVTCFVSLGTLNINSISQSINQTSYTSSYLHSPKYFMKYVHEFSWYLKKIQKKTKI